MDYRSFEWRVIVSLILLLMLIQVGGYFVVLQFNRMIAAATLVAELGTGSQVVNRLLAMRHERLPTGSASTRRRLWSARDTRQRRSDTKNGCRKASSLAARH